MGPSNSGKTELICRLLEWFTAQGLRAAVLKHSHQQRLGDENKDTGRYRRAGGRLVALAAPGLLQITRSGFEEPPLLEVLAELGRDADLILVEGYKTSGLPKVGLAGPEAAAASLPDYPHLVAWVSAVKLATDLPVFHPRQVAAIGRFILEQLKC
ncbi:MAG TPA: molybdopterin-guanine dinucleotide biosynthesis protein B [Desulfobaccales bacterium]|nr:molybdopterin-guanine dinucleotide biosynthesis protein B [Desulfobaccales bacterium]